MAKKWKILIGVIVVLMIVGGVGLPIAGAVLFRGGVLQQGWGPGMMYRWESEEVHHEREVKLIDDDGDGVPDRGVIELPEEGTLRHGRFTGGRLTRFGPGHWMPFGGYASGPFFIVGGLIRLAFLAGVIMLGVVFYRKWRKAHPVTPPASE